MNNWFVMLVLQSLILFSLPTVGFADHGGEVLECVEDEIWDPNSEGCVMMCTAGIADDGGTVGPDGAHCKLIKFTIGGELIPLDTSALLVAQAQSNAAWMIPVIVSAVGIGLVMTKKF